VTAPSAAGALLLALLAGPALGAEAPLPVEVEARGGRLVARLDLAAAFPDELRRTFSNGLTNVVTFHVALLPEGGDEPAALYGREVDVRYDVWEERFWVLVKDSASPGGRRAAVAGWDELRALLAQARDVDLAPASSLGDGGWVLLARVELNPVSRELLERTREFIANPVAGLRGGPPTRSVIGAIARYLLKGPEAGGGGRSFRSRAFTAREVAAR
jgi:hypothetical protein